MRVNSRIYAHRSNEKHTAPVEGRVHSEFSHSFRQISCEVCALCTCPAFLLMMLSVTSFVLQKSALIGTVSIEDGIDASACVCKVET